MTNRQPQSAAKLPQRRFRTEKRKKKGTPSLRSWLVCTVVHFRGFYTKQFSMQILRDKSQKNACDFLQNGGNVKGREETGEG